jgi:hypothetical protein
MQYKKTASLEKRSLLAERRRISSSCVWGCPGCLWKKKKSLPTLIKEKEPLLHFNFSFPLMCLKMKRAGNLGRGQCKIQLDAVLKTCSLVPARSLLAAGKISSKTQLANKRLARVLT